MCENERAFLGCQFVFLLPGLLQQLFPHNGEYGAEKNASENLRGLVARKTVTKLGHVTIAQPPAHTHVLMSVFNNKQGSEQHSFFRKRRLAVTEVK